MSALDPQMIIILSIFGFMHDFWTIPTTNMVYTRLQNYINMVVDKHEIKIFKVVVVVLLLLLLSFDVLYPQVHMLIDFGQVVCQDLPKCQLSLTTDYS
jgi:hypothetical protein